MTGAPIPRLDEVESELEQIASYELAAAVGVMFEGQRGGITMDETKTTAKELLEELCLSAPLVKVMTAGVASLALIAALEWQGLADEERSVVVIVSFLAGLVYTQLFEYGYHRYLMHARVAGFAFARKSHLHHHAIFHGKQFATRDRARLNHVAGKWYHFPAGLLVHYVVLLPFLSPPILVTFLAGIVVHYIAFEASHWFAHVDASALDRALACVPVLGTLRRWQIRHHRRHHEVPNEYFNFNPPFLGDCVFSLGRLESAQPKLCERSIAPGPPS